ncbi:hypothetical protein [Cognatishimia sp. MH4019]|uniref:hypothetical protein n=1 Tax=Cognatishimia sp. MH4019 TaxID=2854030 RepID=UPI001CD7CD91|nr:hypothetical protein [Cognatishimia sp. MH4019]
MSDSKLRTIRGTLSPSRKLSRRDKRRIVKLFCECVQTIGACEGTQIGQNVNYPIICHLTLSREG